MNVPRFLFRLVFGRRLPITTGTLAVTGIEGPVLIQRDKYGIPYIEAEKDDDAWYGLGFCQGQDRSFQIEGLLRASRGTLAELTGREFLSMDRLCRRIGFRHAAEKQLEVLDDKTRQTLEAFARGVTDGSKIGCRRKAHEFSLLRTKPTPFLPTDVLAITKLMSFNLASNWDAELARLKILLEGNEEILAALDPTYPEWLPVTDPPGARAGRAADCLSEDLAHYFATVRHACGSNNWAIAPGRTATGRPILANDPHLPSSLPSFWYLAHVHTPNFNVGGASLVATPVFPVGHNDVAAWGITVGLVDNTDLFIEEIGPDGRSVRQGDSFIPCEVRLETIHVKDAGTKEEEVLLTPRGPIISPAFKDEEVTLSIAATWLAPRPLNGLLDVYQARNFEQFRRAFRHWPFLSLNLVYADTSGTIGWQLAGETPKRRKGWGTIPLHGWDPEVGWEDEPVPFDDMPYLVNPETGFVATANNQPIQEGREPFLGVDWLDGYRQARIVEVLQSRRDWDLRSMQNLQRDQQSIPWREMRNIVLAIPATNDETRQGLALLESWDGVVGADSSAATVFELFVVEMIQRIAEAKAPQAYKWVLGSGLTPLEYSTFFLIRRVGHLVRVLREQPEGWFQRSWPGEIADALTTVIRHLRKKYGRNPDEWAWGQVRPLALIHPVGERRLFNKVFNLKPFPWGGDSNTIGQATGPLSEPTKNPEVIASLRMVVDVGNWEESRFALPSGQSGNPLSPHYDDLLPFWKRGDGVPIAWSPEQVARLTKFTLQLVPRQESCSTP
jgi:penicillin amidase